MYPHVMVHVPPIAQALALPHVRTNVVAHAKAVAAVIAQVDARKAVLQAVRPLAKERVQHLVHLHAQVVVENRVLLPVEEHVVLAVVMVVQVVVKLIASLGVGQLVPMTAPAVVLVAVEAVARAHA